MDKQYDIHDRIFNFVIRGLKVVRYLPKTVEAKIIIDQYIRALTSVGANDNEADGVSSKRRFHTLLYNSTQRTKRNSLLVKNNC